MIYFQDQVFYSLVLPSSLSIKADSATLYVRKRRGSYPSLITTHAPPWGVSYSCGAWVPAVAPPWGLGCPGLAGNHPRPLQCVLLVMHTTDRSGCAKPLNPSVTGLCGAVAASHVINRPIWGSIPWGAHSPRYLIEVCAQIQTLEQINH